LKIKWDKLCEQHESLQVNYDDVCEKLHVVTKRRYELETKVADEVERNGKLRDALMIKEETISRRMAEVDQLEKEKIDRDRELENMAIKREGAEKQNALQKQQLKEKVDNLNEIIESEKETRQMWIERYEKEQKEHTKTQSELIKSKSDLKDQVLAVRNEEIKLATSTR
jgi:hypothetical protein